MTVILVLYSIQYSVTIKNVILFVTYTWHDLRFHFLSINVDIHTSHVISVNNYIIQCTWIACVMWLDLCRKGCFAEALYFFLLRYIRIREVRYFLCIILGRQLNITPTKYSKHEQTFKKHVPFFVFRLFNNYYTTS